MLKAQGIEALCSKTVGSGLCCPGLFQSLVVERQVKGGLVGDGEGRPLIESGHESKGARCLASLLAVKGAQERFLRIEPPGTRSGEKANGVGFRRAGFEVKELRQVGDTELPCRSGLGFIAVAEGAQELVAGTIVAGGDFAAAQVDCEGLERAGSAGVSQQRGSPRGGLRLGNDPGHKDLGHEFHGEATAFRVVLFGDSERSHPLRSPGLSADRAWQRHGEKGGWQGRSEAPQVGAARSPQGSLARRPGRANLQALGG